MVAESHSERGRLAFVLAGGGSLGAVQAGMLAELTANGLVPDFVVGVSAGALNGAFYAHEPTAATVDRMADLWTRTRTRDVLGLSFGTLLGFIGLRDHLAHADGLRRMLERELGYRELATTRLPLHVVAADAQSGDEVLLTHGDVIEAVLASTAIPGVFPAVEIAGRRLVDGVVAAGTPIATAARLGATRIVVLPAGFTCAERTLPRHPIGRAMHAVTLLGARQLRHDYGVYSSQVRMHLVPPLCPLSHSSYDYSHGAALISRSRASTRAWLDGGGLDRQEFPGALVPHRHAPTDVVPLDTPA
jgi:NTE family protein